MSDRAIIESINKIVGNHKNDVVTYVNATVIEIDLSTRTCTCSVTDGHTEYELTNVNLMPIVDDGILFVPKINSAVKLIMSYVNEPFICQYSAIDNIIMISDNGIQLQDGSFGGLIKIEDLTEKINKLVGEVKTLTKRINEHTHTYNAYPAVPTLTTTSTKVVSVPDLPIADPTELNKSDYENTSITHGS